MYHENIKCLAVQLFIVVLLYRWMTAYSAALSFRTSHYFVSYLSEVTATAVGIGYENTADGSQDWYGHADMYRNVVVFVYAWLCILILLPI